MPACHSAASGAVRPGISAQHRKPGGGWAGARCRCEHGPSSRARQLGGRAPLSLSRRRVRDTRPYARASPGEPTTARRTGGDAARPLLPPLPRPEGLAAIACHPPSPHWNQPHADERLCAASKSSGNRSQASQRSTTVQPAPGTRREQDGVAGANRPAPAHARQALRPASGLRFQLTCVSRAAIDRRLCRFRRAVEGGPEQSVQRASTSSQNGGHL